MADSEVRPVDRARAAQMVCAQVTGDAEMFAVALDAAIEDPEDWSLVNVIRSLSEDLAGAVVDRHGDAAAGLVRAVLASQLAEVDQ